jgi:hypothetical protein
MTKRKGNEKCIVGMGMGMGLGDTKEGRFEVGQKGCEQLCDVVVVKARNVFVVFGDGRRRIRVVGCLSLTLDSAGCVLCCALPEGEGRECVVFA